MSDRDLDIALARALGLKVRQAHWCPGFYEDPPEWCPLCKAGEAADTHKPDCWYHGDEVKSLLLWAYADGGDLREVPEYSGTWYGLGRLVEAMWAQGWRLHVMAFPPEMVRPVSVSWSHIEHQSAKADGDGVPQQAALAAARALGIAVEE